MYELGKNSGFLRSDSGVDTFSLFSEVLLVEDDSAHAKLITRALSGVVGNITRVSNGAEAILAIESSLPELVLCDLHLPDMSGLDVLHTFTGARPGLPVIVMTSSIDLDDAVAAMRSGAWDYMVKQFSGNLADQMRLVVERTAERKLREMRELQIRGERDAFWAAVHIAQDGLAIVGSRGDTVFFNQAFQDFCRLFGDKVKQDGTVNIVNLLEGVDKSVAQSLASQLSGQASDSLWSSELQIQLEESLPNQKQASSWFELTLSSVKLGQLQQVPELKQSIPEFQRYLIWVRDISQRKEHEKFQRDLLSTTTHDLKGPLGAILTSAELLTTHYSDNKERNQELVTRISSCARNCITLIDELLSARRIQDGVLVVKPRWYELAEIINDVVLDYLPMAKSREIDFSYNPIPEDMRIFADKIGLTRVLNNLVSNAIKFTPKNGKVTLNAERVEDGIKIAVIDTGSGIESQVRHQLFKRYSRLEKHQQVEGTGLGLFVTKNIVDAHGGRVEMESKVGLGSSFSVIFPDEGRVSKDLEVDTSSPKS